MVVEKEKFFVFIFVKEKHFFSLFDDEMAYQRKRKPKQATKEQKREMDGSDQMNWVEREREK